MIGRRTLCIAISLAGTCLPPAVAQTATADDRSAPVYALPYAPGAEYLVGQGYLEGPTHEGLYAVDWLMPEESPIHAAQAGVMIEVVNHFAKSGLTEDMKSKANRIVIQHDDGSYALYLHLAQDPRAMRELQDFLSAMDLQAQPEIARLVVDLATAGTANEALLVWWDLFALP
jgi:hypothetical protein